MMRNEEDDVGHHVAVTKRTTVLLEEHAIDFVNDEALMAANRMVTPGLPLEEMGGILATEPKNSWPTPRPLSQPPNASSLMDALEASLQDDGEELDDNVEEDHVERQQPQLQPDEECDDDDEALLTSAAAVIAPHQQQLHSSSSIFRKVEALEIEMDPWRPPSTNQSFDTDEGMHEEYQDDEDELMNDLAGLLDQTKSKQSRRQQRRQQKLATQATPAVASNGTEHETTSDRATLLSALAPTSLTRPISTPTINNNKDTSCCFCCSSSSSSGGPVRVGNMTIFSPWLYAKTGWGMAGPHLFGPVCVLGLLWLASVFFIGQSWRHEGPRTAYICLLFALYATYQLIRTSLADPGVVMPHHIPPSPVPRSYRWCDICQNFQPPTGAHCPDCNVCIMGYDHHCVWMGTCIGRNNMVSFVRFNLAWLLYLMFCIGWVVILGPLVRHSSSASAGSHHLRFNQTYNITAASGSHPPNATGSLLHQRYY